jgi:hypothetical protein
VTTPAAWEWDTTRKRYVDVATRRALSRPREAGLRHEFALTQRTWAEDAAAQLARKQWTIQKWEREARDRVKLVHLAEYLFGRGGKAMMTPADYGRVGRIVKDQYEYLHGFAGEIAAGGLSEAKIADRLTKYFEAGTHSFERGRLASYSGLLLPALPADGGTVCRMRCRCRWQITESKTKWTCYWRRTTAESCPGCRDRAARYAPYIQRKSI